MSSAQTKLVAAVVLAIVIAGGAMVAIVLMQPAGESNSESDCFVEVVGTDGTSLNVTLSVMMEMDVVTGNSSYQNTYGNIRGEGNYTGVKISDLLELVGGMTEDYLVRIEAGDGYSQSFAYSKVYPNSTIYAYQGDMILAYGFDGQIVPEYVDGFRLAFIPEDGYYSNADANASTDPNPSAAGPQWVSNVTRISLLYDLYSSTLDVSEEYLRGLPSVTGYGGYKKNSGAIVGPFNYTGVPFSILLQQFPEIPENYFIKSLSGDGYTREYTKDVVEGSMNGYTPTGDPIDVINSTMVLAYEENGTTISGENGGPLKIVFLNEDGNLTDGSRWAKDVVSITVLEVITVHPTLLTSQDTSIIELIMIPTKYY